MISSISEHLKIRYMFYFFYTLNVDYETLKTLNLYFYSQTCLTQSG